jgi:hypothetical protein
MDAVRLNLVGDCGDLCRKLIQLLGADRARCIDRDDNLTIERETSLAPIPFEIKKRIA